MGVLLYSVFKSDYGSDFTIEIHDTEFTGTPSEFKTDKQGFTLDYSSETDDIVSPIIGSSCTIGMYVENVNQEFDLISKLKEYQEDRFYVRIYSSEDSRVIDITDTTVSNFNTRVQAAAGTVESTSCLRDDIEALGGAKFYIPSVSSDIYWTGKIVQDLVVLEDEYYPYLYQIQAVDGIGLLANQDYNTAGNKTLFEVFKESIDLIGIDHLYAGTNFYLSTCFNYWDVNQTYDVDVDSSTLVRFNTFVYRETNDDGSFTEPKALDVLKELCTLFGARIYQRRGAYVLEQYKERADVEYRYFNYDTQGDELTVADKVDDAVIAQTSYEGARLNGGAYNFLPALKRVEVTYNQKRLNNLLANRLTFTGASSPVSLGTLVDDNNAQINLNGNVYYSFIYDGSGATAPTKFYRSVFRIQLKQEDVNNPGTFYYLKRDFQPTGNGQLYSATSWSTSASYYYFDAGEGKNNASGLNLASSFNIITPPLQVDGNATLDIEFYSLYEHSLSASTYTAVNAPTNYNDTATINEVTALYLNNGVPGTTVQVYTSTNANTKVASNLTLDLGEVSVGDSQGLDGSFYIYNGTTWAPSTSWRRGNSGSYISLYKLLTKEVLSFYRKPVERYSGTILAPYTYGTRLKWGSKYYMPTSATYNAGFDEWSGEWFAIDAEETDITVNEPIDLDPVDAGFVGRISGQSGADEIVVATEIVTDNATVSNDVTAGGNVSAVDVTASNDITAKGNVTAVDVTASGDVSATDVTASGQVGAGSADISGTLNAGNTTVVDLQARDAQLLGTADIAGDATLESDLEVQGNATTQGVTTQNGALVHSVKDLSHSDGSSYSVVASDYMLFNSWTGGGDNGEAVVKIPSAASNEGRLLRFKSDDTITANKRVILVPSGSETIDGATSYTMNRSYDGIMILAHSSRWYIIQRKEK